MQSNDVFSGQQIKQIMSRYYQLLRYYPYNTITSFIHSKYYINNECMLKDDRHYRIKEYQVQGKICFKLIKEYELNDKRRVKRNCI